MNIRLLRADEIEVRVQNVKKNGCVLLLYKDARVDMNILDETFGPLNWKRTHHEIKNNLFCAVSIWDSDKKEWVSKEDVGVESYSDKAKGESSDAFKRANVNIGIGRELYTAPFVWISLKPDEVYSQQDKFRLKPAVKFSVSHITYDEHRVINGLTISDNNNVVRYRYGIQPVSKGVEKREREKAEIEQKIKQKKPSETYSCHVCGVVIDRETAKKSYYEFNKQLFCKDCQKKVGGNNGKS